MANVEKRAYAEMYGPTIGDRVRLADTDLFLQVEAATSPGPLATAKKLSLAVVKRFAMEWLNRSARAPKAL